MCSGFSISRQCRSAWPNRSSASSSALDRDADQAEIQPAPRHVVGPRCPRRSPDRPRGPGSGLRPVARRPSSPSHARVAFSPLPSAHPVASARAPARRSHGCASASRPVSMQNLPYAVAPRTSRWSSNSLAAVTRAVDGVDHLLPQRNRPHVQVVVAQRGGAENPGVGDEITRARRRGRDSRDVSSVRTSSPASAASWSPCAAARPVRRNCARREYRQTMWSTSASDIVTLAAASGLVPARIAAYDGQAFADPADATPRHRRRRFGPDRSRRVARRPPAADRPGRPASICAPSDSSRSFAASSSAANDQPARALEVGRGSSRLNHRKRRARVARPPLRECGPISCRSP